MIDDGDQKRNLWDEPMQVPDEEIVATVPPTPYTQAQAAASLQRAVWLVLAFAALGAPVAWYLRGWQSACLLLVGAGISASGLYEWRRLMTALLHRMDAQDAVQASLPQPVPLEDRKAPSIGFAVAGFIVRLGVVIAVLYASLRYLHGSVLALAAGLAMSVLALLIEGLRLLRSGTI
ncbi:hypothetical protein [Terriglobus aquaticus]|uniref:DUF202 domain-containing protein n=1 Tax=Terriglobus aquaticus TaxID=940139 RepID=A0ABW9KLC6_9BACT|nr:hypothetical protein [Terriglobus aquaticus]